MLGFNRAGVHSSWALIILGFNHAGVQSYWNDLRPAALTWTIRRGNNIATAQAGAPSCPNPILPSPSPWEPVRPWKPVRLWKPVRPWTPVTPLVLAAHRLHPQRHLRGGPAAHRLAHHPRPSDHRGPETTPAARAMSWSRQGGSPDVGLHAGRRVAARLSASALGLRPVGGLACVRAIGRARGFLVGQGQEDVLAFFVMAALADSGYPGRNWELPRWGLLLGYGLVIELVQWQLPYREPPGSTWSRTWSAFCCTSACAPGSAVRSGARTRRAAAGRDAGAQRRWGR